MSRLWALVLTFILYGATFASATGLLDPSALSPADRLSLQNY